MRRWGGRGRETGAGGCEAGLSVLECAVVPFVQSLSEKSERELCPTRATTSGSGLSDFPASSSAPRLPGNRRPAGGSNWLAIEAK